MLTTYSKIPIKLAILLVGFGLLLAGCDSAGTTGETGNTESTPLLEVTNDLGDRTTTFGDENTSAVTFDKPGAKFTLRSLARFDPPSSDQTASHITSTGNFIFVGYKVADDNPQTDDASFGGGIDILNASQPANVGFGLSDNALRSPDLDVQELAYDNSTDNLYVAGAVDFGNIPERDFGNSPATIVRAEIDAQNGEVVTDNSGNVRATEAAMPDNVTKSVAVTPSNQDGVLAITDNTTVFSFDSNLNLLDNTEVSGGVGSAELRSVSTYGSSPGSVFTFDTSLQTFTGTVLNTGSFGSSGITQAAAFQGDPGEAAISRASSVDLTGIAGVPNQVHHFVGLNEGQGEGGLRVFSEDGSTLVFSLNNSDTQEAYTSVTVDTNNERVYAAGVGGSIDIFNITSELGNRNDTSTGLTMVGSFDASRLQGLNNVPDGQINQILYDSGNLYLAAGSAGVLAVEVDDNGSDIF